MNAIISNGNYTAPVQLPVERRQLAGALSYFGKNHASAYDIKYNEESDQRLSFTLKCRGVVENAIAKAIPTGFRFHTLNDTIALMHNLPYQSKRELNRQRLTIKTLPSFSPSAAKPFKSRIRKMSVRKSSIFLTSLTKNISVRNSSQITDLQTAA